MECNWDIRVGKIIEVRPFPEARKPAYQLRIDLGTELGIRQSSAQLVTNYTPEQLQNRLVLCAVNLGTRQIGSFRSEVLTLGIPDATGQCRLLGVDTDVPLGGKVY